MRFFGTLNLNEQKTKTDEQMALTTRRLGWLLFAFQTVALTVTSGAALADAAALAPGFPGG